MEIDFISSIHKQTKRDYLGRVNGMPKAEAAKLAKQWGKDYWDGSRETGYGGNFYDGRWREVAQKMVDHYKLKAGDSVLDVGCGKGFLLYEFTQIVPGIKVIGIDISRYALENAKPEIKGFLNLCNANNILYPKNCFDLVISINTLHNLNCEDLYDALGEIDRVGTNKYICVESFRTEEEKVNLLYWQLTAQSLLSVEDWKWWFEKANYNGDFSFVFFN